ncbi:Dyp-type peroxidase [Streptomyces sp. NPDC048248]|uniref:Dyp-type peroxidase n=1 Tax=Streptomyces sp. NPDC048248 TaxID=3365523 RepID=UPI003718E4BC
MRRDRTGEGRTPARGEGRREFLRCAAGIAGVAAAAGLGGEAHAAGAGVPAAGLRAGPPVPSDRIPFHGRHQAGIVTPQQLFAAFLAFDVQAENPVQLTGLFKKITERARVLVSGELPGDEAPAADRPGPDSLSITLGVGASLFDDRFGLTAQRPRHLKPMPAFPDDRLVPSRSHGDLSLQICAQHRDAVVRVMRDLARETSGLMRLRWRADGFLNPSGASGTPRDFLGFKQGIADPAFSSAAERDRLLWVTPPCGEPDWAVGGSYQVLRLIRFHIEAWDRLPVTAQERIFGRHKASGAPLGGRAETEVPDFRDDPKGARTPLNSHIRLADPRTPATADSLFLRRNYSYDGGFDTDGRMDLGLVFCGYQQNVERQFAAVQQRLEHEPLAEYVTPVGGGYFFALPGVRTGDDWFGSDLLHKG